MQALTLRTGWPKTWEGELRREPACKIHHERAGLIGGKLTIWTAPNSGTEIELRAARPRAYSAPSALGDPPGGN